MSRLIHLNGPSRVGKSTVARRYAAEHPDALDLDVDLLVETVDGWRDDFDAALRAARELAAMRAIAHLRSGRDVVLPQLVTSFDASPWVEELALRAGSEYVEIALLASRDEHRRRLRDKQPDGDVDAWVQEAVSRADGELLEKIVADLDDYLAGRPDAIRVDTGSQTPEETYAVVLGALRGGRRPVSGRGATADPAAAARAVSP